MEKKTPHCRLSLIRTLVQEGRVRATASALRGAVEVGIPDLSGICAIVLALTSLNFYKSMTTQADHRIWQDVYHATTDQGVAVYLKLTVIEDLLIVSFKEL